MADSNIFRTCRIQNPDIFRAGRYGAAHGGTAGPGGDGQHRTPTGLFAQEKTALLIFLTTEDNLLGVSLEARTKETLCKPMEEQSPRLTTVLSAVYVRICGTTSALRSWLLTKVPTPIVFVNPFLARHVREFPFEPNLKPFRVWLKGGV